jgi:quercetin dioxygenase-like cupin family protein
MTSKRRTPDHRRDSDPAGPSAEAVFALLADALQPIMPAPDRAKVMLARTLERIHSGSSASSPAPGPTITVRGGKEGWVELLPKIHAKLLATDGTAESYLVRLEPGARAPAHGHPDFEECVVLEGSIEYVGAERLQAGDYQAMRKGTHHPELVSETGALVFLRYARPVAEYIGL